MAAFAICPEETFTRFQLAATSSIHRFIDAGGRLTAGWLDGWLAGCWWLSSWLLFHRFLWISEIFIRFQGFRWISGVGGFAACGRLYHRGLALRENFTRPQLLAAISSIHRCWRLAGWLAGCQPLAAGCFPAGLYFSLISYGFH